MGEREKSLLVILRCAIGVLVAASSRDSAWFMGESRSVLESAQPLEADWNSSVFVYGA